MRPVALPASFRPARRRRGYTLVEVVVGMVIFSVAAISLGALTMMARRSSEEVVYRNTALTLAQAYVEQLRSADYTTLQSAAASGSGLFLVSSSGGTLTDESGGLFSSGDWASEVIMLDEDENGNPRQPLTFRFRPVLTDLSAATTNTALGVEIVLHFETSYNFGNTRTFSGSLRTVRSNIPTY